MSNVCQPTDVDVTQPLADSLLDGFAGSAAIAELLAGITPAPAAALSGPEGCPAPGTATVAGAGAVGGGVGGATSGTGLPAARCACVRVQKCGKFSNSMLKRHH